MCGMVSLSLSQQHDGLIDPSLCISPIYMLGYWAPRLCSVESRHPSKPPLASPFILYSIGPWWWSRESPTVYAGSKCRPGSRLLQIPRTRTRDKDISLARALNCLKCYYTKTFFLSFSCFFSVCLSSPLVFLLWYSISYRSIASVFFFSIYRIYVWGVYILSIPMSL